MWSARHAARRGSPHTSRDLDADVRFALLFPLPRPLNHRLPSLLAAAALCAIAPPTAAQSVTPPAGFDAYVERVLTTFDVPGAAVAIVKDGQVVLAKGYGIRTIGKPDRVDASTRFGI